MKKLIWIALIGLLFWGCAEDIIVEASGELRGAYEGVYEIVWNYSSGSGQQVTEKQNIEWAFTDLRFFMNVPEEDTSQITNNISGNYAVEERLILSDIVKEPGSFKPESVPEGEFSLIRSTTADGRDSLSLQQLDARNDALKTIIIVRLEEE